MFYWLFLILFSFLLAFVFFYCISSLLQKNFVVINFYLFKNIYLNWNF